MKKFIYIVTACADYGGMSLVRAFEDKGKAEIFIGKCIKYNWKKPLRINLLSCREDESKAWHKKHHLWAKKHPAGIDNACKYDYRLTKLLIN